MVTAPPNLEQLVGRVIGCGIAVHRVLGPGLLESVYRDSLRWELLDQGIQVKHEHRVPVVYKGRIVGDPLRVDLLVEDAIIVEVKSVDQLHPVHVAQVITYLKLTDRPAGLLMNFNTTVLKSGLRRVYHPDLYPRNLPKREPQASDPAAPELC